MTSLTTAGLLDAERERVERRARHELADLIGLFRDELGVELTERDLDTDLDALPGWDSVHLLRLVMLLEEGSGRRLSLPDVLEARTVRRLHTLVGRAGGRP